MRNVRAAGLYRPAGNSGPTAAACSAETRVASTSTPAAIKRPKDLFQCGDRLARSINDLRKSATSLPVEIDPGLAHIGRWPGRQPLDQLIDGQFPPQKILSQPRDLFSFHTGIVIRWRRGAKPPSPSLTIPIQRLCLGARIGNPRRKPNA